MKFGLFGRKSRMSRMRRRLLKQMTKRLGRSKMPGRQIMLEAGMALFAVGLVVGLAVLLAGRGMGRARQSNREAEEPPVSGSIPSERHDNLAAVAAR